MDNLTIIRRYITKNFDIYIDERVRVKDKMKNTNISLSALINEIDEIFDYNSSDICDSWYKARLRQETMDIHKYLDSYHVNLGDINWETLNSDGKLFDIKDMVEKFENNYNEKFIRALFNDWYIAKIYKSTEDRLNFSVLN